MLHDYHRNYEENIENCALSEKSVLLDGQYTTVLCFILYVSIAFLYTFLLNLIMTQE